MTSVRRWVAAAVVVPLMLAGCSEDPEPKFQQSPSPSPTESTSEASQPEAWEVKSQAGAVAFAKHWIDVFNEAMGDEETTAIRAISAPNCGICTDFADRLDRIHSSGGFYRSEGWEVLTAAPVNGLPKGEAAVSLRIREGSAVSREASGSKVVRTPPVQATWSSRMDWTENGWLLTDLRLVQ